MENQSGSVESLIDRVKSYVETRIELLKLKAIDKSSSFLSYLILIVLIIGIGFTVFILLSIALALFIGDLLGRSYYGFLIVAGIYIIAGLVVLIFRRRWIKAPIANSMIKNLTE